MNDFERNKVIHEIWEEVSSATTTGSDDAMRSLLDTLKQQLNLHRALWISAVRKKDYVALPVAEILGEWYAVELIESEGLSEEETMAGYRKYMELRAANPDDHDPLTTRMLATAGNSRSELARNIVSEQEWDSHWVTQEYHRHAGIGDLIYSVFTVDEDCESWIVLHRGLDDPPFTEGEREFVHLISMGVGQLHRMMSVCRGAALPCKRLLSHRERDVLKLLIRGLREKEIATELDIAGSTARGHLQSIYRKYQVGGKFDLLRTMLEGG